MNRIQQFIDKVLPWRIRIRYLETELMRVRVELGVTEKELLRERGAAMKLHAAHETNKRGTGILLQFLTRTARLNVPTTEGSIRESMQKEMTK